MPEQSRATHSERQPEEVNDSAMSEAGKTAVAGALAAVEEADDFLDKIDELLGTDEEAQDFVDNFIQKGGQ